MKSKLLLVKSPFGWGSKIKNTLRSLRLKKIGDVSVVECNDSILGRVQKVKHLLRMEKIDVVK